MRSRLQSSKDSPAITGLVWVFVGVIVAGGVFQGLRIRQSILHALHKKHHPVPAAAAGSQPDRKSGNHQFREETAISNARQNDPAAELVRRHPDVLMVLAPGSQRRARLLVRSARAQLTLGNPITARELLNRALGDVGGLGEAQAAVIRQMLNQINRRTLFSSALAPGDTLCRLITIKPGQTPDYLANIYRITPAMLRTLNPSLNPSSMQAGSAIKILLGPIDATLVLHAQRLDLSIRSQYIFSFPMRTDAIFPPAPGRYRIAGRFFSSHPDGRVNLDHISFVPVHGRPAAGFTIRCLRPQDGGVEISSRAMRTLMESISSRYSRVEVAP